MSNYPKLYAHRGAPQKYPENSLAAFKQALEDGADGFECDVVLTKDLEPVLVHLPFYSNNISKLVGEPKTYINNLDWSELKDMRVSNESILHLDDLLSFVAENEIECFIEPKRTSPILMEKIVKGVERYGVAKRTTIVTFFSRKNLLKLFKELNPSIKTSVILISPLGDWAEKAKRANADIVIPGWKQFNHQKLLSKIGVDFESKIHQTISEGVEVISGEADDKENLEWLCDLGVKGIFTNNVPLARTVIDSQ